MTEPEDLQDGTAQFYQDVFPAELEEIRRRRKKLDLPDVPAGVEPSVRLGLVGLALSGGGIRSSTFCLGVIQGLAKHGFLKNVDYLSTVSGGGFIGGCLSSLLNSKDTGLEQDRFPLRFQVGAAEPLSVSHLRDSARYLAPGGFLHKLRIPALVLRGVVSNLLIFLLLILLMVFATEVLYEVGQRAQLSFRFLVFGVGAVFLLLVIGFPVINRLLPGRSTWRARNIGEMAFTVVLLLLMFAVFLVPVFILLDQAIDRSWSEVQESMAANLLNPFEARDLTQWAVLLVVLLGFMLAGRASAQVSQVAGKMGLVILGLVGPFILGVVYLSLVVLEIDSPYITPNELFSLDVEFAEDLDDRTISPALRRRFLDNRVPLSNNSEIIELEEDVRWLVRDGERAYTLVLERNDLSVYPDFQDALSRGHVPPELISSLQRKGYPVDPATVARPIMQDNRFEIGGSHHYWVNRDPVGGRWSLEQIVAPETLLDAAQSTSYDLPFSDDASGVLIHEGVSISDDGAELAIRFIEEGNPHDVVLLIDNSSPPFSDREAFREAFRLALTNAVGDLRSTVHLAVFLFDKDVHRRAALTPMTPQNKGALIEHLFGETDGEQALRFQSELSNSPAALVRASRELKENGRSRVKRSIVLISDGVIDIDGEGHDRALEEWIVQEFAELAAGTGIRIYGIALSEDARFRLFQGLTTATGGSFFPVYESRGSKLFEDLVGAMNRLKESAGSRLTTPLNQVSITDDDTGTTYLLTRSGSGIRIRAAVADGPETSGGLEELNDRWREIFADNGIELTDRASVQPLAEGRWEVTDPYRYVISRSGKKLRVLPFDETGTAGDFSLNRLIPSSIWDDSTDWLLVTMFAILLVYWLSVDVNATAVHSFYRDRLSSAYLIRVSDTGDLEHNDKQKLSHLNRQDNAPYHLINAALNLVGSPDPSLRGRQSGFFTFGKLYTGSVRTGFLRTEQMERLDPGLDLGTAIAVSGAAAAPNRGATTVKSLIFIMTLLNIRLGYWLPNPRFARSASWLKRLALRRGPGPKYLLKESLGHVDGRTTFINVSDGGHIENLGVFELLRRRCKLIVAVDGEHDPEIRFQSLVKLMLYARIEMGIEMELDLDPIRKDSGGLSSRHISMGKIQYAEGETGHLLYVKASLTGDEVEYIREYATRNPDFPHETTADQFFNEDRFEAYRALGYHIGEQIFADSTELDKSVLFPHSS